MEPINRAPDERTEPVELGADASQTIRLVCAACQQPLLVQVEEGRGGETFPCPTCGETLTLPVVPLRDIIPATAHGPARTPGRTIRPKTLMTLGVAAMLVAACMGVVWVALQRSRELPKITHSAQPTNPVASLDVAMAMFQSNREDDWKHANELLERLAGSGDRVARRELGVSCEQGRGTTPSLSAARDHYLLAAEAGDTFAMRQLSRLLQKALGGAANPQLSIVWLRKATEAGDPEAWCDLGVRQFWGDGIPKDRNEAYRSFQRSAALGSPRGLFESGLCLMRGQGTDRNPAEALKCFEKSADAGYVDAMLQAGAFLGKRAQTVEQQLQCFRWFERAANVGSPHGLHFMAVAYRTGTFGQQKQPELAVELFRRAIAGGNVDSQIQLASCYLEGDGVAKDTDQAFQLMLAAAEAGQPNAMAFLGLGYGIGAELVPRLDWIEALTWLNRAAAAGSGEAMVYLGICHANGDPFPRNPHLAAQIFRDAALKGHGQGMLWWGNCLSQGLGVKQDRKSALDWFLKAGQAGESDGFNNVGTLYLHGRGVSKDVDKALEFFLRAAEAGSQAGMLNAAFVYLRSGNPNRNEAEGRRWLAASAAKGNALAQEALQSLARTGSLVLPTQRPSNTEAMPGLSDLLIPALEGFAEAVFSNRRSGPSGEDDTPQTCPECSGRGEVPFHVTSRDADGNRLMDTEARMCGTCFGSGTSR